MESSKSQTDRVLISMAPRLRTYIASRIPRQYRRYLSADDVLQCVWQSAIQQLRSRDIVDLQSTEAWLINLTKQRLIDQLRRLRALRRGGQLCRVEPGNGRTSILQIFDEISAHQRSPSSAVAAGEAAARLTDAISRLSNDERRAVCMRYLDGSSIDVIASRMGRSVPAVRSYVYRGVKKLRVTLGDPNLFFSNVREDED